MLVAALTAISEFSIAVDFKSHLPNGLCSIGEDLNERVAEIADDTIQNGVAISNTKTERDEHHEAETPVEYGRGNHCSWQCMRSIL